MNILTLIPCVLFVLQKVTTAAVIGPETNADTTSIEIEQEDNSFAHEKNDSVDVDKQITDEETPQPTSKTSTAFHEMIAKGKYLKNQYGFLLPKISILMLSGRFSLNPFSVMSVLPYIILGLQKTNEPSTTGRDDDQMFGLNNFNLKSAENLKNFFADKNRAEIVIGAMKDLAGPDASRIVDKLIENVKQSSTDKKDGTAGIDGERVFDVFQNSDSLKKLFKTEQLANEGLNLIDNYMNTMLNPELKDIKDKFVGGMKDIRKSDQGENDTLDDVIRGTMKNSLRVMFNVGHAKTNEMLRNLNSEAVRKVADWRSTSGDTNNNESVFAGGLQNMILNKTPDRVLTLFATGNVLKNRYSQLIPQLGSYFLPVGVGMDALKFVCLLTYVMLTAKQQNFIPEIGKIETLSGINADKIINTLNNKEIIDRISPLKSYSDFAVEVLRFLAGPEAVVVDNFVEELKKIKNGMGGDQAQLTLFDLFKNSEFAKKLYAIKGFTDEKMKNYLGFDIDQLTKDIMEEMNTNGENKAQDDNGFLNNYSSVIPKTVNNALSATYKVCARKTNEQIGKRMKNITEVIKKLTDKNAQASSLPGCENTGVGMFKSSAVNSLAYGLSAGKTAVGNRLRSFFQTANNSVRNEVKSAETRAND